MSYCKNIVFLLLSSVLDVGLSTVILSQLVLSQLLSQLIEIVGITPITHLPSFPCTFSNGTAHYNATSPQQCSMLPVKTVFSLGGSTVDLWLLSTVRLLFVFVSLLLTSSCCRQCCRASPLFHWRWALSGLIGVGCNLLYVAIKTLARLVDGPGSGSPSNLWFWSQVAVTGMFSIPQCQFLLYFLHDYIFWLETKEQQHKQLGTSRATFVARGMLQQPLLVPVENTEAEEKMEIGKKKKDDNDDDNDNDNDDDDNDNDDDEKSEDEDELENEREEYEKVQGQYTGVMSEQFDLKNGLATRRPIVSSSRDRQPTANTIAWFRPPTKKKKKHTASVWKLIQLGTPDWPWLVTAFMALLVAAIGQARIPALTGQLINEIAGGKDIGELRRATTELTLTAVVTAVFTALRGSIFTLTMAKLNVRVRNEFFSTLLEQEMGFFDTVKTGDITSRLSADTTKMSDQISLNVNVFLRSVVQACGVLFFMFRISVKMSLVTFASVPAVVVLSKVYGAYYRSLTKSGQKKLAAANCVAEEALGSMSTVKSFAAEISERRDYASKLEKYYKVNQTMALAYTVYAVMFTVLPNLVTALVLFYGGKLVIEGDLQPGDLVSFMLFQQALSNAFNTIGNIWTGISGALGAADKVFEYIGRQPKIPLVDEDVDAPAMNMSSFNGNIDMVKCRLKYPSRPETVVLNDISISVRPGEVIALVGPSGGGKSSCLRLINRLYLPDEGSVLLDGKDAHAFDRKFYHRKIAIVGQEPVLFGRSIRRNILYGMENLNDGKAEPTMDDIVSAAKLANAHDFIMSFPKQYLTKCGERGVSLSGGQKQRIAIARALIRKPSILLLDEATSALDTESEAVVQRALDDVMRSRALTCIVVAHRLSTVQNANRILVVVDGTVKEIGTHTELLAKPDSLYRKLVQRQLHSGETSNNTNNTKEEKRVKG